MSKEFKLGAVNAAGVIANERLCLTADRKTVVKADDKNASFLFAAVGQLIPIKQAQQYGLVSASEAKAEAKAEAKGVEPESRSTRPAHVEHKR